VLFSFASPALRMNVMSSLATGNAPRADVPPLGASSLVFPQGFLWGVSTAAHQVEGGNDQNQWADWETAGKIKSGDCSGDACNWWKDAEGDFDLARDMGLNAMRLSIEWSRIEPEEGRWDEAALGRYRQLLQGLHERAIRPMLCLHHFTNPRWFEREGAFLHAQAPERFARFAKKVVNALGDLCHDWVTFNEPNVYAAFGYVVGEFPPGKRGQIGTALRVISAQARAHLLAYRAIHELQPEAQVGWAQHFVVFEPVASALDRWVAQLLGSIFNDSFLQLMEHGKLGFPLSFFDGTAGDVKGACDFIGLNVYSRFHVAFDLRNVSQLFGRIFVPPHVPQGDSGVDRPYGEAYPLAVRAAVQRASRLGKPIYILENGVPDAQDRIRPWLIVSVLKEIHHLIAEGFDIRGYFHWTLTDNFEWTEGWKLRFGLVALDHLTQQRTMRESGRLYGEIARTNSLPSGFEQKYAGLGSEQ
jgi:beta-glucosidase